MKLWILTGILLIWNSQIEIVPAFAAGLNGLKIKSINSRYESFGRPLDLNTIISSNNNWDYSAEPQSQSEENDLKMTSEGKDLGNLRALKTRLKRKRGSRRGRMMKNLQAEKSDISDLCATSSSVRCGQRVLDSLAQNSANIHQKCRAREEFLDCLGEERLVCRGLVSVGLAPTLPQPELVKEMQEQIYSALWTSGRCTLL